MVEMFLGQRFRCRMRSEGPLARGIILTTRLPPTLAPSSLSCNKRERSYITCFRLQFVEQRVYRCSSV